MVFVMTAGTAVIMWLGELITDRGVGNGMSILIFTSIAATFPSQLWSIRLSRGWGTFLFIMAVGVLIVAAVVFVEQSQRRIPVQYAKRMIGRTPGNIVAIRPLKDGVIADFDITREMIKYFIRQVHKHTYLAKPRIVMCSLWNYRRRATCCKRFGL